MRFHLPAKGLGRLFVGLASRQGFASQTFVSLLQDRASAIIPMVGLVAGLLESCLNTLLAGHRHGDSLAEPDQLALHVHQCLIQDPGGILGADHPGKP